METTVVATLDDFLETLSIAMEKMAIGKTAI